MAVSKDETASLKALMNQMSSSEVLIALSLVTNNAGTSICMMFQISFPFYTL